MIFNLQKFNKEIEDLKRLSPAQNDFDPKRKALIKQRILNMASAPTEPSKPTATLSFAFGWFSYSFATLIGLVLVGCGLALASNYSKPGDVLFPVKKITEQTQIQLAPSLEEKVNLETQFAERRLEELKQIQIENIEPSAPAKPKIKPSNKAEQKAEAEVSRALENLKKIQVELRQKGNTKSEEGVKRGIEKLERALNARQSEKQVEQKDNRSHDDSD